MGASKAKGFLLHSVYYVFAAFLIYSIWSYTPSGEHILQTRIDTLQNIQEKELETFLDMNRFVTALSTAAVAGLGAIIFNRLKKTLTFWESILAGLVFFSAGFSLYWGYRSYEKVVWMLHSHFFDLTIGSIVVAERLQFLGLVMALFFFGDFAISGLARPQP